MLDDGGVHTCCVDNLMRTRMDPECSTQAIEQLFKLTVCSIHVHRMFSLAKFLVGGTERKSSAPFRSIFRPPDKPRLLRIC